MKLEEIVKHTKIRIKLLRIKNAKNDYWKVLLVGDACFRKF